MILQLNPPIPLKTPKGDGLAWLVLDYGAEHNLMWTVAIDDTGELWTFSNHEVKAQKNITMGRTFPAPSDLFKGALILDDQLAPIVPGSQEKQQRNFCWRNHGPISNPQSAEYNPHFDPSSPLYDPSVNSL